MRNGTETIKTAWQWPAVVVHPQSDGCWLLHCKHGGVEVLSAPDTHCPLDDSTCLGRSFCKESLPTRYTRHISSTSQPVGRSYCKQVAFAGHIIVIIHLSSSNKTRSTPVHANGHQWASTGRRRLIGADNDSTARCCLPGIAGNCWFNQTCHAGVHANKHSMS